MTKTILQYTLHLVGPNILDIPQDAEILKVMAQPAIRPTLTRDADLCIWAMVDTELPVEPRKFTVIGNGQPVPQLSRYLGSAMLETASWSCMCSS
jgi:hypothetical protein